MQAGQAGRGRPRVRTPAAANTCPAHLAMNYHQVKLAPYAEYAERSVDSPADPPDPPARRPAGGLLRLPAAGEELPAPGEELRASTVPGSVLPWLTATTAQSSTGTPNTLVTSHGAGARRRRGRFSSARSCFSRLRWRGSCPPMPTG